MATLRIKDKVALITGAASGIGKATAQLLAQEGAQVIITDIQNELGEAVAEEIEQLGCHAYFHPLEASQEAQWQALGHLIQKRYGALDILVNNAGITGLSAELGPQDPEHASLESWRYVHQINLESVFLGCKYGIEWMKSQGGAIINMSSRSGMVGIPHAAAYASSKAAVRNHTKSVALYCAEQGYNIRCNSIHPAAVLTPIWDAMLGKDPNNRQRAIEEIVREIPLKRMGEPLDVAYAVLYLASDEAKYITGIELTIDGGILAGSAASLKTR